MTCIRELKQSLKISLSPAQKARKASKCHILNKYTPGLATISSETGILLEFCHLLRS